MAGGRQTGPPDSQRPGNVSGTDSWGVTEEDNEM